VKGTYGSKGKVRKVGYCYEQALVCLSKKEIVDTREQRADTP